MVVTGCVMLTNGDMLIADHWDRNIVLISNESDKHAKYSKIPNFPYDLTMMDSDHIAITHGESSTYALTVLKLSTGVVEKEIPTKQFAEKYSTIQHCFGISYWDNKLYVMVEKVGIVVLDTSGKALDTISIDTEKVGQEIWVYQDKSIVEPCGLAVASNLDVFISCSKSNNVILIRCDGKDSKIVLQKGDNLVKPKAIHFNRERRELLVCNESNQHAAVYKVV
ncbi:unnamed protein product [Mytilus edulis]|uniref:Uncharacterized protein n=1 Tax=Mytilus edulis TaxID=6550 RepID=A0A8S3PWP6_MYTED|nr:unnamed protein product [Mytilus edulis]